MVGVVGLVCQLVLPRPRAVPAEVYDCWQFAKSTIEMAKFPWELKYPTHKKKGKSSSNFKRTFYPEGYLSSSVLDGGNSSTD